MPTLVLYITVALATWAAAGANYVSLCGVDPPWWHPLVQGAAWPVFLPVTAYSTADLSSMCDVRP